MKIEFWFPWVRGIVFEIASMRDSRPYALIVNQNLDNANNMTTSKAVGEVGPDNSFDADGNSFIASILTPKEHVLLFFNDGRNLNDLSVLRGLSETLEGKSEEKIGIMNNGYLASESHFAPDRSINMSRNANGDPILLDYNSGEHYAKIKASRENYADASLVPQKFMNQGDVSVKIQPYLKDIFAKIRNPSLQKKLMGTLEVDASKGTSQFFLTLFVFKLGHKLYNNLDDELKSAIRNFNFLHGLILKEGLRTIYCEYSDGKQELLNKTTALDLHSGAPKLRADCDVYVGTLTKDVETVIMKVTLSMDGFPGSDTFWITNQPTNNQFKGTQPLYSEPQLLRDKKLPTFGSFVALLSVLSDKEADAQKRLFGGDFSDVNSLRGIFLAWNNRYLGRAWWDDNWGASRNSGHIRAEIRIRKNRALIQKLFNIQTDKSQMSCVNAHPVAKRFLSHLMGNTIKTIFTSTKKTKQEKDDENFKYQYAWNPQQMFHVIKMGELTDEMALYRKNLLNGTAPPAAKPQPATPSGPQPATPSGPQPATPSGPQPAAPANPVVQPKPAPKKKAKSRTPSPEARPSSGGAKIPVEAHLRSTSKSPQELLTEVMNFSEAVLNSNIQDIFDSASTTAQKGLVDYVNALQTIKKYIGDLGVKFEA